METFSSGKRERPGGRVVDNDDSLDKLRQERLLKVADDAARFKSENLDFCNVIEGWLHEVNFEELRNILSEYALKSGVAAEDVNFPGLENIYILEGEENGDMVMSYNLTLNTFQIYAHALVQKTKSLSRDERRADFLRGLFHEYTHATARVEAFYHEDTKEKAFIATSKAGLNESKLTIVNSKAAPRTFDKKETELFELLNEGITERIADEVIFEYIRRIPVPGGLSATRNVVEASTLGSYNYDAAKRFTMALTDAIARESGVPEDVVWKGLVRQYYRGDSLFEQEIHALLNTTLGPAFTEMLSKADKTADFSDLAQDHSLPLLKEKDAAQRWLTQLEVTRSSK